MSVFPFKINDVPFYPESEINWQEFGMLDSYTYLGRPNPSGQASFTITLRALAYDVGSTTGAGDPFQSSGTFKQLFALWQASPQKQTYQTFDPYSNTYIEVTGILDIAELLKEMPGGMARPSVTIKVDNAFLTDEARAAYTGGDPFPLNETPEHIPGDPLPPPDPLYNYGWNVGGWNSGPWDRGEGVLI